MSTTTDKPDEAVPTSRDERLMLKYVGKVNADVKAGWRVGLTGKTRFGKSLYERLPPSNLLYERKEDWIAGRDGASKLLETRNATFVGRSLIGPLEVKRKGWPERWKVIGTMEKKGAVGSVQVYYFQDGEIVREHDCML